MEINWLAWPDPDPARPRSTDPEINWLAWPDPDPHTVEVRGSNPRVPTMITKGLQRLNAVSPFLMVIFRQHSL